jgi:iron complex outermembrane receptor protein
MINTNKGNALRKTALAMSLAAIPSLPVAAQEGSSDGSGKSSFRIEEVRVTARKIEESLQDTPVAVSAFGEQDIERLNPQDLRDIGAYAPNVSVGSIPGFNAAAIAIRGVSTGDIPSSFDPAVTVAVDGFYYGHAQTSLLDMFDLQQIEILRGPQGTLFGKNTIGGVVNVTSKRPTGEWGVEGEVSVGNYSHVEAKAAVDIPFIEDVLAGRFAFMSTQNDGYYTNTVDGEDIGGKDVQTFRGRFLFTPTDSFEALLSFEWEEDRSDTPPVINTSTAQDPNGYYGSDLFYFLGYPGRGTGGPLAQPLGDPFDTGLVSRYEHVDGFADYTSSTGHFFDIEGVYLNMSWDVLGGTITSITGKRSVDSDLYNDYLGENVPVYATMRSVYRDTFSQELRFASNISNVFDYQVGVYFQNNELDYINHTSLGSGHPFSGILWPAAGLLQTGDGGQETDTFAVFGEANYHLTEKWGLTLGARYTEEEKDFNLRPIGVPESGRVVTDNDWDSVTYRLGTDYRLNDEIMLYATFSTGFKSGGFNEQATSPATAALSFDEEEADAFEVGMKSDLFDGRLRLNVAAFYTEYEGLQLDSVVPVEGSAIGQESTITNAGSSTVQGVEIEATARVTEYLTLQGTLGYLDAEYDEFDCDLDRNPANGNEDCTVLDVKRTPEVTASGGITFDQPVADLGSLSYNLNFTYTDSYYNDVFNSVGSEHEDVFLLNGSITLYEAGERYRIGIFGRNLTDEEYQTSGLGVANLWSFSTYGAPRTYGLELGFNF